MKQIPLSLGLEPSQSFDSFMPGANTAALEHLRSLLTPVPVLRPSTGFSLLDALADPDEPAEANGFLAPVYLWGPTGSGKTHLLRALAHERELAGERVAWFTPDDAPPWSWDDGWSLIVLDDCERFDVDQQQAAFALFVQATTLGTQVAAAGTPPPVDLALRDDLRTRLGWGHVFALLPLGEAEARAALRREADRRGIFLSDDVMGYLLTRFSRDLKHLMALLGRLDGFALERQRAVTVPLLKQMLNEEHCA